MKRCKPQYRDSRVLFLKINTPNVFITAGGCARQGVNYLPCHFHFILAGIFAVSDSLLVDREKINTIDSSRETWLMIFVDHSHGEIYILDDGRRYQATGRMVPILGQLTRRVK